MFRITEDPSSGSLVQCLAKNYKNDSIVSVDMEKAGVMAVFPSPVTHTVFARHVSIIPVVLRIDPQHISC